MATTIATSEIPSSPLFCQKTMQEFCESVDPVDLNSLDGMSRQLRREAMTAAEHEPELRTLLLNTVLAPGVRTFEDAVACTITYRLLLRPCHQTPSAAAAAVANLTDQPMFCPNSLRGIIAEALHNVSDLREAGHTMSEAVRMDALAVCERDPAVDSLLEVVLFLKGFAALVCHRAAYYKWHTTKGRKSMTALWLQSQASAVFGMDIHPAAQMGAGILLDHGTGIVIGETATVGDGCTLLHGVTLGGTGKDTGDRHPKVGRDVLIGANASLLGNIPIGDGAKIGAGSVVLRPIPAHATAVGAPAKIVGRAREDKPASTMDETLLQVSHLHKSTSDATLDTADASTITTNTTAAAIASILREEADYDNENSAEDSAPDTNQHDEKEDDKGEENEEDTPTTNSNSSEESSSEDCCCPFRNYRRISFSAPAGTINFCTLQNLLKPEGCDTYRIGEIFFNLDERDVGYIKPDVFFTDRTLKVLTEKSGLSAERVAALMADFRHQWREKVSKLRTNSVRQSLTVRAPRDIPVSG